MKKVFFDLAGAWFKTGICAVCCLSLISLSSCSDDENENGENSEDGGNTAVVVDPSRVFTGGVPKSVSGMVISQNKEGLVTSMVAEDGEKAVFEYFFNNARANNAVKNRARITVTDEFDTTTLDLVLNNDGYAESCRKTDSNDVEDWKMEYDAQGHVINIERELKGMTLTYNEDGNVAKTFTHYWDGDLDFGSTIDYTTDKITTPIENKGCVMLIYETMDVDIDEVKFAYYGGMLGKATKHLPLVRRGDEEYQTFTWTLNADGYPTELLITSKGFEDEIFTFSW